MKKILYSSNFIYFVALFLIFILLCFSWRYAVVRYDDIIDYVVYPFLFSHGRFLFESINIFFINILPNLFGVHIQDFAWFSESLLKAFYLVCVIYVINLSYFRFKKNDIMLPFLSLSSLLFIFASIYALSFVIVIEITSYFTGYLLPIIFYLLFWYKLENFYVKNTVISKKDIYSFIFISAILIFGTNELYIIAGITLLILLYFDYKICSKLKNKSNCDNIIETNKNYLGYFSISYLFLILLLIVFVLLSSGMLFEHKLAPQLMITKEMIFNFLYVFFNRIFVDNIVLCILAFLCIITILLTKKNRETGLKVCKFVIYSYIAFLLCCLLTFFLGESYNYTIPSDIHKYPKYWINYPGILLCLKLFLYVSVVYMIGYIESLYSKLNRILIVSIIIFSSYLYISVDKSYKMYSKIVRENAYINDKIVIHYFNNGSDATISFETADAIMSDNCIPSKNKAKKNIKIEHIPLKNPIRNRKNIKINDIIYVTVNNIEVSKRKARMEKYNFDEKNPYILYLRKVYPSTITKEINYIDDFDEAMDLYLKNGGKISVRELSRLKFADIAKK